MYTSKILELEDSEEICIAKGYFLSHYLIFKI